MVNGKGWWFISVMIHYKMMFYCHINKDMDIDKENQEVYVVINDDVLSGPGRDKRPANLRNNIVLINIAFLMPYI
jgi:hypothetical protein